jgi:putative membrane protein
MRARESRAWKGAAAGIVGGLVAAWMMNQFQAMLSQVSNERSTAPEDEKPRQQQEQQQEPQGEDATQRAASAIAEPLLDRRLTKDEKQTAGPVVHYAFGGVMGGLYGALAELSPGIATGRGMPFGAALWLGADEVAVPALRLSAPPTETPASTHVSAFAAHLVYGLTTDLVRRAMRNALFMS